MNPMVIKVVELAVKGLSIALPFALNYFDDKKLDEKIAKKAAEAVAEALKKGES